MGVSSYAACGASVSPLLGRRIDGAELLINEYLLQPQALQNLAQQGAVLDPGFDFASVLRTARDRP